MMRKGSVAIITARGGSKRIPRKNIKSFCGEPIISYSIRAALYSGCFDEVMVSTDDVEIADLSLHYGASVPFYRSSKTSGDFSTTADVIKEVLNNYEENGLAFSTACCIYPTAPFITPEKLVSAKQMLESRKATSVISVVRFDFPPQRAFVIHNEKLSFWMPENASVRSQDLPPLYHDAGQFYFFYVEKFNQCNSLLMEDSIPYICPDIEVQDIDNDSDWLLAEIKYRLIRKDEN